MAEWADLGRIPQWSLRAATVAGAPTEPNMWIADREREFLWLGPDEWLVVGTSPDGLNGHHSIVDVSANRRVLEVTGADRIELLLKGCSLDLHPQSWRKGMCAQTLLSYVPVILQERDHSTRVFVRPSLAQWIQDVGSPGTELEFAL